MAGNDFRKGDREADWCRTLAAEPSIRANRMIERVVTKDTVDRVFMQAAGDIVFAEATRQCVISSNSLQQVATGAAENPG